MVSGMNSDVDITPVILTFNEEKNLAACLSSLSGFPRVFVVDSGSTDATPQICKEYGAQFVYHSFLNHATQWQWALDHLEIETDWVLALDADYVVTPELRDRILREIPRLSSEVVGVYVRHLYQFGGGVIRFGGTKRTRMPIFRRKRARTDAGDLVDSRFVVNGKIVQWPEALLEYNRNDDDSSVWLMKQDKYALRLAVEEELRRRGLRCWTGKPDLFGTADERFSWLRDRWLHMPLFVRPLAYFLYRYVFAGGFLDGRAGFLYAALQGFWLRLLIDVKTIELRQLSLDDPSLLKISKQMLQTRSGSVSQSQG